MAELGERGSFDLFAHMKKLVHKIGFLCWIGPRALNPKYMTRLVLLFAELDPEESFKSLRSVVGTVLTNKYKEKRALDELTELIREIWIEEENARKVEELERSGRGGAGSAGSVGDGGGGNGAGRGIDGADENAACSNLASLHAIHTKEGVTDAQRHRLVAIDVFQFQLASLANLYAAASWTVVMVLTDPAANKARVIAEYLDAQQTQTTHQEQQQQQQRGKGNRDRGVDGFDLDVGCGERLPPLSNRAVLEETIPWISQVAQESLRLSQQSITLRKVLRAVPSFSPWILPVSVHVLPRERVKLQGKRNPYHTLALH